MKATGAACMKRKEERGEKDRKVKTGFAEVIENRGYTVSLGVILSQFERWVFLDKLIAPHDMRIDGL